MKQDKWVGDLEIHDVPRVGNSQQVKGTEVL